MSGQKGAPLTKEEVMFLVQLVEGNPIVFSKATNASNNLLKDVAWNKIADQFNAMIASYPRKLEQLRLKWENLKKAARKRSTKIRMNNLKTGGGKPDYIPPDEALDKVAAILGPTCDGYTVSLGGDAVNVTDTNVTEEVKEDGNEAAVVVVPFDELHNVNQSPGFTNTPKTKSQKFFFSSTKGKRKFAESADEVKKSLIERNKAITDYYNTKRANENEIAALKKKKLELQIKKMERDLQPKCDE